MNTFTSITEDVPVYSHFFLGDEEALQMPDESPVTNKTRRTKQWVGGALLLFAVSAVGIYFTTSNESAVSRRQLNEAPSNVISIDEVISQAVQHKLGMDLHSDGLRLLQAAESSSPTADAAASVSSAPSASGAPSESPSGSPTSPYRKPATPSSSPSASPTSSPDGLYGTLYFVAYLSGREEYGCEKPLPAMTATCNGNGKINIIDHPEDDHNCVKVDEQTIQCAPQEKAFVQVRCDTVGLENPEDLVLNVTLPESDLTCDACIDEDCDIIRADMTGESYNRLFLFTGCNEKFYNIATDVCSTETIKYDNQGNQYCESMSTCQIPGIGETCQLNLDATVVSATGALLPEGGQCIYPLGYGMATPEPTLPPTNKPTSSPTITRAQTLSPTQSPSISAMPSVSAAPSESPSVAPTN